MKAVLLALALLVSLIAVGNTAAACDPSDPGFPPGFTC